MQIRIEGGHTLIDGRLEIASVHVDSDSGAISALDSDAAAKQRIDASGLLVLPGIVDIHGDAFERQMMPRPGVDFPLDVALCESDRQDIANGITTVFHGVTWSWEPGLRGAETRARSWTVSSTCGPTSAPTRGSTFGTRPTISTPRPKSSPGWRRAGST